VTESVDRDARFLVDLARTTRTLRDTRHQVLGDLAAVAPHRIRALGPVWDTSGVTEIDDAFVRQLPQDLAHDSESADAGVEDPDW